MIPVAEYIDSTSLYLYYSNSDNYPLYKNDCRNDNNDKNNCHDNWNCFQVILLLQNIQNKPSQNYVQQK